MTQPQIGPQIAELQSEYAGVKLSVPRSSGAPLAHLATSNAAANPRAQAPGARLGLDQKEHKATVVVGSNPITMSTTAFVAGGTGSIDINLIKLLVREGWWVTALHRATSNLTYLRRFSIVLAEGSITDRASLERAIPEGTDAVFHVAGDTNFWSKKNRPTLALKDSM